MRNLKSSKRKIRKINLISILTICCCLGRGIIYLMPKQAHSNHNKEQSSTNYIATVMLDAGHGGYDGGTIADDGTCEKDITLDLALETGKQLQKINPNIKVVYTRTSDDVSWPEDELKDLNARISMSKKEKADYYFSFHINSNEDPTCSGYTSYIRKNDKEGKIITKYISNNLSKINWSYDRGTQTTEFYPLHVVDKQKIPSILFEAGFSSNQEEINALEKKENQKKIGKAIAKAFNKYITEKED